jgi:hypothetical protein
MTTTERRTEWHRVPEHERVTEQTMRDCKQHGRGETFQAVLDGQQAVIREYSH